MARAELRFGTVVSVSGRDAMVRFPGIADPVPVRCVEGVPQPGRKVGCWQTTQRVYYLSSGVGADGSLTAGGLNFAVSGAFARVSTAGYNLALKAGTTEVRIGWNAEAALTRQTQAADPAGALVTKGYVDAVKAAAAAATSFADFQARIAAL